MRCEFFFTVGFHKPSTNPFFFLWGLGLEIADLGCLPYLVCVMDIIRIMRKSLMSPSENPLSAYKFRDRYQSSHSSCSKIPLHRRSSESHDLRLLIQRVRDVKNLLHQNRYIFNNLMHTQKVWDVLNLPSIVFINIKNNMKRSDCRIMK